MKKIYQAPGTEVLFVKINAAIMQTSMIVNKNQEDEIEDSGEILSRRRSEWDDEELEEEEDF
jgi:hypothetical protein